MHCHRPLKLTPCADAPDATMVADSAIAMNAALISILLYARPVTPVLLFLFADKFTDTTSFGRALNQIQDGLRCRHLKTLRREQSAPAERPISRLQKSRFRSPGDGKAGNSLLLRAFSILRPLSNEE
jgi:hypothetical protein